VYVEAYGKFTQDYGTNPSNYDIGTESYRWAWAKEGLEEFTEDDGVPALAPARTSSGHFTPILNGLHTYWTSEADESESCTATNPQCPLIPCPAQTAALKPKLELYTSIGTVELLSDQPANVRKAFKGHRYVFRVSGGNSSGLTPCGIYSAVATDLEPPRNSDNSENQEGQPFGPNGYWVTLPPSNDLRHAKGARDDFKTEYHPSPLSFTACGNHYPGTPLEVGTCNLHRTTEDSTFSVDFKWFPRSDLDREIKQLKKKLRDETAASPAD